MFFASKYTPAGNEVRRRKAKLTEKKKTTIVLFSGDYDKAMAAYIIANGAAAYDHEVTIFHTFWGLNALRKDEPLKLKKGFLEKVFGKVMPRGADKMGLSKMNFTGMGPKMIKHVMKKHNAMTLPQLIEMAQEQDVKLIACTMTMDLLGLQQEELLNEIEYAGVAAYLADAEEGHVNLFI
jgi:peroxiredoxin family protein